MTTTMFVDYLILPLVFIMGMIGLGLLTLPMIKGKITFYEKVPYTVFAVITFGAYLGLLMNAVLGTVSFVEVIIRAVLAIATLGCLVTFTRHWSVLWDETYFIRSDLSDHLQVLIGRVVSTGAFIWAVWYISMTPSPVAVPILGCIATAGYVAGSYELLLRTYGKGRIKRSVLSSTCAGEFALIAFILGIGMIPV